MPSTTPSRSRQPPSLDAEELARRVVEFGAAAAEQRRAFDDERTLLARDVAALMEDLAERLFDFARNAPAQWTDRLQAVAPAPGPVGRLEDELQGSLETAVQECFEEFRQAEADRVEQAWSALAERFRAKTEARANRVRATAADLFTISLPDVAVPEVSSEREQFFYLFLHVDPLGEDCSGSFAGCSPLRSCAAACSPVLASSWPASSTNTPDVPDGI